jgi:hypothetical protein
MAKYRVLACSGCETSTNAPLAYVIGVVSWHADAYKSFTYKYNVLVVRLESLQNYLDVFPTCFKIDVKVDEGCAYRGATIGRAVTGLPAFSGSGQNPRHGSIFCKFAPTQTHFMIITNSSIEAQSGADLILASSSPSGSRYLLCSAT